MKLTLWGTRGSLPAGGPENVRYGGNTSCVGVEADGAVIALDAGTGLRRMGGAIDPSTKRVDVFITHLHLDHIQGLGFFAPLYKPGMEVHIWGPPSATMHLRERLARYLSPPLFPVQIRDLPCKLELHDLRGETVQVGGVEVFAEFVCHPGPTLGYRLTSGGVTIAYLPDHEPALGCRAFPGHPDWTSGFPVAAGADVLLHDSQYSDDEYDSYVGWGHSTLSQATAFAAAAGVGKLVAFHHDPAHDDETIDRLLAEAAAASEGAVPIVGGKEGDVYQL